MDTVKVSVVIPAFKQAEYLEQAITSVLCQTHRNVEAIVVDDASPDDTASVVRSVSDKRLKYLRHNENQGLGASRNTGYRASEGEIVAFLDADDYFHPEKIAAHVTLLTNRPDVGVSYNSRFELNHSRTSVRELFRAPTSCALDDLVMGFPFAPSDMVVRRDWFERVGLFDERLIHFSEDLDINCRLALAGCSFAGVDRGLNYRRYHSRRHFMIRERRAAAIDVLERVFADPRCPASVRGRRDEALARHSMVWAFYAFVQGDGDAGTRFLRFAVKLDPSYLLGEPTRLTQEMLDNTIADASVDHEGVLTQILTQFPPELCWLQRDWDWARGQGYLRRGLRTALWASAEDATEDLRRAKRLRALADESFVQFGTYQLLNLDHECGGRAARTGLERLRAEFSAVGDRTTARQLEASYHVNRAFQSHRNGRWADALADVGRAVVRRPRYATDRGVVAMTVRSIVTGCRPGRRSDACRL